MKFTNLSVLLLILLATQSSYCQADMDQLFQQEGQTVLVTQTPSQPKVDPIVTEQKVQQQQQQQKPTRRSFNFQFTQENLYLYRYQIVALMLVILYLIGYQRGKNSNYMIAAKFYEKTQQFIQNNFAHTGFSKEEDGFPLASDSGNELLMYASGRQNCEYMQVTFKLQKRQDLLYHLIYETIYPEKDLIFVDIPVKANHPIVFCLAAKKKLKALTQNNIDIAKLAGSFEVKNLNQNFSVLGQSAEIVDQIVDNHVVRKIQELTGLIMCIHYTDQKLFSQFDGHLRAIFFASTKNQEKYLSAVQLIFYIVDRMTRMKISAGYKAKASTAREAFSATKQKQALERHHEELRKKKQQKKRQEEAWLRSLPPQKQKRQDEKRKKKQMNKMLKSKTMKVM